MEFEGFTITSNETLLVTAKVEEDPRIVSVLAPHLVEYKRVMEEVVAYTRVDLDATF